MHLIDWIVLLLTIVGISAYGVWRTRGSKNLESYLASDRSTPWWAIGLSIMATQASAITFISTPGLGYEQGLRFAQFYYGLPIAMVIIAIWFAPRFFHLKVFTAYEFLEERFDLSTRLYTAALFLIQRGLAAGVTIYAPSIILAEILGWNLLINIWIIGILVIVYTVSGGTKAVTKTHQQQMAVIFTGLIIAFGYLLYYIQAKTPLSTILDLAGEQGMLNAFVLEFDLSDRYNVWSGLLGGTFLMLSYFGTDQSQVQRYISGKSLREIRIGLYINGILKIPMQFFILFIGVLVFWFYQMYERPITFDNQRAQQLEQSAPEAWIGIAEERAAIEQFKQRSTMDREELMQVHAQQKELDRKVMELSADKGYKGKVKETDHVFISWVLKWLPKGLVGLLIAVIFSAAMSSTAAELNALATTTIVDFYQRLRPGDKAERHDLHSSRWFTLLWGLVAIGFASVASLFDNLVEFVNILGSLFYGTVLGIFLVALYMRRIRARAVLTAGIIAQAFIFYVHFAKSQLEAWGWHISFLWYNLIACVVVLTLAQLYQWIQDGRNGPAER